MRARAILVRIGHAVLSMFGLSLFVFLMVRLTGDPLALMLPDTATTADFDRMREQLGLDQSVAGQYVRFLGDLLSGNLGTSIRFGIPVTELVESRVAPTLALGGAALLAAVLIGVPLGVYSAYRRGGWFDRNARFLAVLGQSAPPFWVGLILIMVVAVQFGLLPAGGHGGIRHLILPAFTIAWGAIAGLTRLVRSSMIEVLNTDYIKFLRIKGVPEREIVWKHGLRNAGLSAMTFAGVLTAGLLTGSVVVETVFAWPGMGLLMSEAITGRDFPLIQGVVLVFALVYIVVNLAVDLLYAVLNPRLR